jgi:hypothetical protein
MKVHLHRLISDIETQKLFTIFNKPRLLIGVNIKHTFEIEG